MTITHVIILFGMLLAFIVCMCGISAWKEINQVKIVASKATDEQFTKIINGKYSKN